MGVNDVRNKKQGLALEREVFQRLQMFEESMKELLRLSEPFSQEQGILSRTGTEVIYRTLTEDVCRKCPKYRECFGEKKEKTSAEISGILEKACEKMQVDGKMASGEFRKQCVYFQPFIEEMSWLFRLLYQNRCWEHRMEELRQVMRKQMVSQYLLMRECRKILQTGSKIDGLKKRKLQMALFRKGFRLIEGQEYVDEGGVWNVQLILQPLTGAGRVSDVLKSLCAVYHKRFQCNRSDPWIRRGKTRVSFAEEGAFQILFGSKHCNKKGETICGDTFSFINYNKKRAVMVLSDGMGVGREAYDDSRKLIETFESLIEAGIHEEYALEILHNILLVGEKTEFSTLDAAVISLQTGMLKTLKAGGTATFIRHGQAVERIVPSSLPPGCLMDQQFDMSCKKLYNGDMVILVSDGMLDFENLSDDSVKMETIMEKIKTNNAQKFAEELMKMVPLPSEHDDDRTVLVASVWERGHQRG